MAQGPLVYYYVFTIYVHDRPFQNKILLQLQVFATSIIYCKFYTPAFLSLCVCSLLLPIKGTSLNKEMMEEELFQLHVATPTFATCPVFLQVQTRDKLNREFFPCWCTPGSSFSVGVQQGS